jgi:hypothetical protein
MKTNPKGDYELMAKGGHRIPKSSLGSFCAELGRGPAAIFYPLGHPMRYASESDR